jgi:hypothetical protein
MFNMYCIIYYNNPPDAVNTHGELFSVPPMCETSKANSPVIVNCDDIINALKGGVM